MFKQKKFIVSHAPFWHIGSGIPERNYNMIIAALPAVLMGFTVFGIPAVGVIALSVAFAVLWELAVNYVSKRPYTVADGHAIYIGLIFGMVMPATVPWWLILVGTFLAIVIGKEIFGGIGSNPFNAVALAYAILLVSWGIHLDFNAKLANYTFDFPAAYPIAALQAFGPSATEPFSLLGMFMGQQVGGIGSVCGIAIVLGGVYLILRGFIRWEISVSFVVGVFVTAFLFNVYNPAVYGAPLFHLVTGYTLIGAFFLATDDGSSPVNFIPMLIYGALGGVLTVLIRNIGSYVDGVFFAILLINVVNPVLDKIRPKALGKVA
ncbi:MAG: RnfABCDGE type electron transport complex subunit D [Desulfobacteraceae bacterium]|nr:RnfABCDGE type electron transport complex subunit D [Desulfobacteraceae bacterium]